MSTLLPIYTMFYKVYLLSVADKWPDKSVYVIGKPRHINLGLYKCEVTNGVGTGVAYYNLNIFCEYIF